MLTRFFLLMAMPIMAFASNEFREWSGYSQGTAKPPVSQQLLSTPVVLNWQTNTVMQLPSQVPVDVDFLPVMIPVPVTAVGTSQNQLAGHMEAFYCLGVGVSVWLPDTWLDWWRSEQWLEEPLSASVNQTQGQIAFQMDRIRQQSAWNHLDMLECIYQFNQQITPQRQPALLQWLLSRELELDVLLTRQQNDWQLLYAPRQKVLAPVFLSYKREQYIPFHRSEFRVGEPVSVYSESSDISQRINLLVSASWPAALSEASVGLEAEQNFFSQPLFPRLVENWRTYPQPLPSFLMQMPLPDVTVTMVNELLRQPFEKLSRIEAIDWLVNWIDSLDTYSDWQLQSMAGLPGNWTHAELKNYLRMRILAELTDTRLLAVSYAGDWFIADAAPEATDMLVNSRGYRWIMDRERPNGHPDAWPGADVFVLE